MANPRARIKWRPSPVGLIASGLVLLGFALCGISWWFFALVALGTFGPGIARELGWLKDQDEFQRRAARRAGYHAYLVGGLMTFLLIAFFRANEQGVEHAAPLVTAIAVVLWFTWLLSSLLAYWGARKTASRILIAFGCAWWLFSILDSLTSVTAFVMASLVAVPFFALAYVARRWPRVAGVLLLAFASFFFYFFGLYEVFGDDPLGKGRPVVLVLFIGPLLASGIALLRAGRDEMQEAEAQKTAA